MLGQINLRASIPAHTQTLFLHSGCKKSGSLHPPMAYSFGIGGRVLKRLPPPHKAVVHQEPKCPATCRFALIVYYLYSYISSQGSEILPALHSSIAQLAEHSTVNRRVTGSSPVGGAGNHPATSMFGSGVIRLWFDTGHG